MSKRPAGLEAVAFSQEYHLGEGLRIARERLGYSIEDVSEATRVRPQHVAALEAMELYKLPSRPFAVGYVRSYAKFLGLDEERAIARFKLDAPDRNDPLPAPIGVTSESDPRIAMIAVSAALVIGAIIVWNVVRIVAAPSAPRAVAETVGDAPETKTLTKASAPAPKFVLGQPLPAPLESTIPPPYVTPGLEEALSPDGAGAQPGTPAKAPPLPEAQITNPKALAYGAPAEQARVVVRARKTVALVVHGPDQSVHFAQMLSPGDVYRAPVASGLTLDVSDPAALDVYVDGVFSGQLPDLVTPVSKLSPPVPKTAG